MHVPDKKKRNENIGSKMLKVREIERDFYTEYTPLYFQGDGLE